MNRKFTDKRMENRKNEVIKKIILSNSNENSPAKVDDEIISDYDVPSLSKGFSSTLNKRLNSLDSESDNMFAERRHDNFIKIGKLDSTAKLKSSPLPKEIIEESKSESD